MPWWMRSTRSRRSAAQRRPAKKRTAAGRRREPAARPSPRRPRTDQALSLHPFAADRLPLPASADLLGVCGPSARPLWALGRLVDDASAAPSLPTVGHVGYRPCAGDGPAGRALVRALALRPLVLDSPHRVSELLKPACCFA